MSARQAVLLGDLAELVHLEITCLRCDRRGRQRIAKLIEQHGADLGLPDLAARLAADCPKRRPPSWRSGASCASRRW